MPKFIDLTDRRYGMLLVVRRGPDWRPGVPQFECRCDCGVTKVVAAHSLRQGATSSCGCRLIRHGHATGGKLSPEYRAWAAMVRRCTNPRQKNFPYYGGRGITVHPAWLASFAAFLADLGPMPAGRWTLDRLDPDGHYAPGNVRWASWATQAGNRRSNRTVTHDGLTLHVAEWSRRTGLSVGTIIRRLNLGWPDSRAVTTPPQRHSDTISSN